MHVVFVSSFGEANRTAELSYTYHKRKSLTQLVRTGARARGVGAGELYRLVSPAR